MNKKTPYILIMPIVLGVLFIYGLVNGIIQSFGYILHLI